MVFSGKKKGYMVFVTGAAYNKKDLAKFYMHMAEEQDLLLLGGGFGRKKINPLRVWSLYPSNPSDLQVLNLANYLFERNYYISNIFTGIPYYKMYFVDSLSLSIDPEKIDFGNVKKYFDNYRKWLEKAVAEKQEESQDFIDQVSLRDLLSANNGKIYMEANKITGTNKEQYWYRVNIEELGIDWDGKTTYLIGREGKKFYYPKKGKEKIIYYRAKDNKKIIYSPKKGEKKEEDKFEDEVEKIPLLPYGGIMLLSYVFYIAHRNKIHRNKKDGDKLKVFIPLFDGNEEYRELIKYIIELAGVPDKIEIINKEEKNDADVRVTSVQLCCKEPLNIINTSNNIIKVPLWQVFVLPTPDKNGDNLKYYPLPFQFYKELFPMSNDTEEHEKLPKKKMEKHIFFVGGAEHNFAELYFLNYLKWSKETGVKNLPGLVENWFELLEHIINYNLTAPKSEKRFMVSTGSFVKAINSILYRREFNREEALMDCNKITNGDYENTFLYKIYGLSAPLTRISLYRLLTDLHEKKDKTIEWLGIWESFYTLRDNNETKSSKSFYELLKEWDEKDAFNNISTGKIEEVKEFLRKYLSTGQNKK